MRREGALTLEPLGARPPLRLVPRRPLRILDVALFYGERSGGIRTYLDAKTAFARGCAAIDHHLLTPQSVGRSIVVNRSNGYRLPLRRRDLLVRIEALAP